MRLLIVLLLPVLVAGCRQAPTAATPAEAEEPVVVALDDFAALGALAVGVTPDLAFDAFEYESTRAVLADQGVQTEPYGSEVNLERVAAARPDVILGVSLPTTAEAEEELDAVAPTTVIDYTATWDEQLREVAAALGREAEAEQLVARLERDAEDLRADLAGAGLDGAVTSVLAARETLFSPPAGSGVGSVLTSAGLARPPAQEVAVDPTSPFIAISPELLADHDGDVVFLLSGGAYDPAGLTGSPLWPRLGAVQAGEVHEVSAEVWLSGTPFGIDWVLRDLRATLLDDEPAAVAEDAPERLRLFAEKVPA